MTPRFWALPAAALLVGGLSLSPAQAADLGGDCCADLEERVAELEATTVRKGNRKVSLKISGFVSKSVMFWDDGHESNTYVGDTNGNTLGTNFSLAGSATIGHGWSAGYDLVIEAKSAGDLTGQSQTNDNGVFGGQVQVLVSSMWVKSDTYGKLSWGTQSQASDNAALLPDLSGTIIQANYVYGFHGGSMALRNAAGASAGAWVSLTPCATAVVQPGLGISQDCNGAVLNNVRYDSPTIAGFTLSTSWGEDDFWDAAISYAGKFGDVKVKAAYAYTNQHDEGYLAGSGNPGFQLDVDLHQVGASALHVPTGLFVYGAYVTEEVDSSFVGANYTDESYYVKAGIRQKWNSLGETIIYGEYGQVNSKQFQGAGVADTDFAEFERYGVGVVQYIDAAAMQLHALWKHNEADLDAQAQADLGINDVEDLDMFIVGGTIFF